MDDDEGTRNIVGTFLSAKGYIVDAASSCEDALRLARSVHPAVVLMDYRLPDGDGLSCLKTLRHFRWPGDGILFTADWELQGECDLLDEVGAVYLSKLCDLDDIGSTIEGLTVGSYRVPRAAALSD